MKLCESPDFRDAISATAQHFANLGLTEAFIEKDYYVTEALRIVATQRPTQIIFKGGTSLSKGWKLIERFSEDIDLFLIALFPTGELRQRIAREYQQQCQNLCYGNYPTWDEVAACFSQLRDRL